MEFLFSNFPPIRTANKTFADAFYGLIPQTSKLDIAVGYVSSDSLMELKRVVELNNNIHELNLIVGMHYFEHFTKVQYKAAMVLLLNRKSFGRSKAGQRFQISRKIILI